MSKELEEVIREYRTLRRNKNIIGNIEPDYFFEFADTILNYIENSIPKEKIEEKIRQLDEEIVNTDELDSYTLEPLIEKKEVLQEILEGK